MVPRNPTLERLTESGEEPVSLASLKLQVRVTHDLDNDTIASCGRSARAYFEKRTGLFVKPGTARMVCDGFPPDSRRDAHTGGSYEPIDLMCRPVASITALKYRESRASSLATLSSAAYRLEDACSPAQVVPIDPWPSVEQIPGAVVIEMTIGTLAVTEDVSRAILMLAGHYYKHRETTTTGTIITETPDGWTSLVRALRAGHHH